jgi:hypothetical protein
MKHTGAHAWSALLQPTYRERLWRETQRIIKCLASTSELELHISIKDLTIEGYDDADFAGYESDRRSTTGWIYMIGES